MKNTNIGWQYYRDYYAYDLSDNRAPKTGITRDMLENFLKNGKLEDKSEMKEQFFHKSKKNTDLLDRKFEPPKNVFYEQKQGQIIRLKTTYPGLIIGSGYSHQTGTLGEFKLGFFFDHTTGLPIIPGSSVKGVLRSYFPHFKPCDENKLNINTKKITETQKAKAAYIYATWKNEDFNADVYKKYKDDCPAWKTAHRLELAIFEGIEMNLSPEKDENGGFTLDFKDPLIKYIPLVARDIFHDAFIVEVGKNGENGKIFGKDSITPHGDNPLKNPIPVSFMKILPNVTFQFNFDLKETPCFCQKRKYQLFENILKTIGIGAKTNVGYGHFAP